MSTYSTVTAEYSNTVESGYAPESFVVKSDPVTDTSSLVAALEHVQSALNASLTALMDAEKSAS
ncbi:hypothetical protein GGI05_003818, partial [Coemansia sp. RSA 2603]